MAHCWRCATYIPAAQGLVLYQVLVGRDREQELSYPTQLQEAWQIFGAASLVSSKKTHLPCRVDMQDAETHGS
jgi:hypothetical protein